MPTRQQCKRALEKHEDQLSKIKDVVGLGVVKLDELKKGKTNNAVAVYVREIVQNESLPAETQIPEFILIDGPGKSKIRVPVRIIEQGKVELESRLDAEKESLGKEPL